MILRNYLLNISQYVIDPDREYGSLVEELNGSLIKIGPSSNTYINIFDIREDSLENDQSGYLQTKLTKLMAFFKLIFNDLTEDEKGYLESRIIKTYEDKNITFDDNSLYRKDHFKTTNDMPIFEDLYKNLDYKYQIKLIPFVKGSLKFFNNYTNIELDNNFIVGDVYELGEDNLKYGMFVFTDLFWDRIKSNRNENKIIYMDEVWKLIGITSNKEVASFIYKIFKTIRKYGGSAVAITQDISDMFSLHDGAFGKSLLNNSEFKAFFNMEEENIKILSENINLNEKEKIKIKSLNKGESLLFIGSNHVVAKIDSSEYEKSIINN
jgi:type IV secretory pathway VirB4 component